MTRWLPCFLAAGLGLFSPAHAAVLDDLLARGYAVEAATTLPGPFTGCVRQRLLTLADESVFACSRNTSQLANAPNVYILGLPGAPPSVVVLGSVVLPGQLLQLRQRRYPIPLRLNADPLSAGAAPSTTANLPLSMTPPLPAAALPLNAQQAQPLQRVPSFGASR